MELPGRVGLGTAPLGSFEGGPLWWGPQDRAESVRTIHAALDAGIGWVDTSPFYGWGLAEDLVAEAIRTRSEMPLTLTKCGTLPPDKRTDNSPAAIRLEVDGSLGRLGVERLDVVQLHDEDENVPIEESWGALHSLIAEGKVGAAGLSNHRVEWMDRALAVGPVAVVQQQYSLLDREPEHNGAIDWCARHGVPFLAWSPLASGYLTDDFDLTALHPTDLRHRLRWNRPDQIERVMAIRAELAATAAAHGCSLAQAAVAWTCRRPGLHAIVGARSVSEAQALAGVPYLS